MSTVNLHRQLTQLTGARQTMLSWASRVESWEGIPAHYQEICRKLIGANESFPHMILAPAVTGSRFNSEDQLVFCAANCLYIVTGKGGQISVIGYPVKQIVGLEIGNILIYSWFSIQGITTDAAVATTTVEFNEATLRHFLPLLNSLRCVPADDGSSNLAGEQAKLDELLGPLSFKFMNYARESLLPGESVLEVIWQEAIYQQEWRFGFWPVSRAVTLAHLAMLTDREVILIRETNYSQENTGKRYGVVWDYFPLHQIRNLTRTDTGPNRSLTITLVDGTELPIVFSPENQGQVSSFLERASRLVGKRQA